MSKVNNIIKKNIGRAIISITSWQRVLFWSAFLAIISYFLYHVKAILLPFILGILIAYIFSPLVDCMSKKFLSRTMATLIIIFTFFGGLITFFSLIFPYIQTEIILVARELPKHSIMFQDKIILVLNKLSQFAGPEQWEKIQAGIASYLSELISWFGHILINFVTNGIALANFLVLIVFTPIIAFYLLRDWHKITKSLNTFVPENYRPIINKQTYLMSNSLRGYAKGQAIVCLILAIYYATALWAIGLKSGALIGFLTGFFAFIPFVAVFFGFAIASITAIYQMPDLWLWFWVAIIFSIGQISEGSFLTPNLIGHRIGLHPVWIIFVILSGAALIGFWGVLIALPLASILSVLSRFILEIYYSSSFHKLPIKNIS